MYFSLLSISGLVESKNIGTVIDAMSLLVHHYGMRKIHLYVVGDGPLRKELEESVKVHNLESHVSLPGYMKDVGNFLSQCDIFLHPAYGEGFGIAVVEAMMAKKPIIAAASGSLPELIVDHQSGLLVDTFDAHSWARAIRELISNRRLSKAIAANAHERAVALFSFSRYVSAYENLYCELLER